MLGWQLPSHALTIPHRVDVVGTKKCTTMFTATIAWRIYHNSMYSMGHITYVTDSRCRSTAKKAHYQPDLLLVVEDRVSIPHSVSRSFRGSCGDAGFNTSTCSARS